MIDPNPEKHQKQFDKVMLELFEMDSDSFIQSLHNIGVYDEFIHVDDVEAYYKKYYHE